MVPSIPAENKNLSSDDIHSAVIESPWALCSWYSHTFVSEKGNLTTRNAPVTVPNI